MREVGVVVVLVVLAAMVARSASGSAKRRTTPDERVAIVGALAALGWPAHELRIAIGLESGWNARALNDRTGAAGLNQLLPKTLRRLGWEGSSAEFAELDPLEQLPWMIAFWRSIAKSWRVPGDTYLAMAAPGFVGASDTQVIYLVGSDAWQANPAWRPTDGGSITAGSIRAVLLRRIT